MFSFTKHAPFRVALLAATCLTVISQMRAGTAPSMNTRASLSATVMADVHRKIASTDVKEAARLEEEGNEFTALAASYPASTRDHAQGRLTPDVEASLYRALAKKDATMAEKARERARAHEETARWLFMENHPATKVPEAQLPCTSGNFTD